MAPLIPYIVRFALGAAAGVAVKEAVDAYARAQRRKEAAFALEQMSSIKDHHRAALEDVAVEFGDQLDEISRRRLDRMIAQLSQ